MEITGGLVTECDRNVMLRSALSVAAAGDAGLLKDNLVLCLKLGVDRLVLAALATEARDSHLESVQAVGELMASTLESL